jgi:hypothetical protein
MEYNSPVSCSTLPMSQCGLHSPVEDTILRNPNRRPTTARVAPTKDRRLKSTLEGP